MKTGYSEGRRRALARLDESSSRSLPTVAQQRVAARIGAAAGLLLGVLVAMGFGMKAGLLAAVVFASLGWGCGFCGGHLRRGAALTRRVAGID